VGALNVGMQWFCRVVDPRTRRAYGSVGFKDGVVGALFGRMWSWMTSLSQLSSSSSLCSSSTSTGASGAAQSQPLGQPRPVKMSTLSATSVGVLLQYLLEANRIAGNVKMKQTPVKTAADDDGSAPFVAGVGGVVDAALKVFPVKGVRVQLTPGAVPRRTVCDSVALLVTESSRWLLHIVSYLSTRCGAFRKALGTQCRGSG
jgi:hypothetical protein